MTRINTNVSSLLAQNVLNKSNANLQQSLTRLSTGLRINSGKDDPAGLIASENLRSDITSIRKAIGNTDRANQVIATADSALGQVSGLLNDIRGLVTESANSGALSEAQIDANQLQLDSSLKALNRIAQTTTFQGRKLLDGSLDFITTPGTGFGSVKSLAIDSANLGSTGSIAVDINVTTAATKAQVDVTGFAAAGTAVAATGDLAISATEVLSTGTFTVGTGGSDTITVTGVTGTDFDGVDIVVTDNATTGATYDAVTNTISVAADITGGDTSASLAGYINALTEFTSTSDGTSALIAGDVTTNAAVTSGYQAAADDVITVTADDAGTAGNITVTLIEDAGTTAGSPAAIFNGTNIEVRVNDTGDTTIAQINSAINGLAGYTSTVSATAGDGIYTGASETAPGALTLAGGVGATGGLVDDLVIELAGTEGGEVFSFKAGSSIAEVASGINLVSDATGVTAVVNGTTLELSSSEYGTDSIVDLKVINEGTGTIFAAAATRDTGTDIVASVNGVSATGDGNDLLINTATLDLKATITAGTTGSSKFTITGGGALFQLGPEVVTNQQARLGIGSVNTARLGGIAGKLYELGTGQNADLSTNPNKAAKIIKAAIDQVTSLRGRLGAFQSTTLQTNKNALNDTLINLTDAESQIRDADFAVESAALTRAQILVQSGTTVLGIANQNPQNALSLLR